MNVAKSTIVLPLQSGPKPSDAQKGTGGGDTNGTEKKPDPEELLRRAVCTLPC